MLSRVRHKVGHAAADGSWVKRMSRLTDFFTVGFAAIGKATDTPPRFFYRNTATHQIAQLAHLPSCDGSTHVEDFHWLALRAIKRLPK